MQKQKKFIALALVVFLAFLALGKYKQSTALASADVLYTVEVKDKKTGQTVKFEIQQTKKHRYRVKNTKTGQIYETRAKKERGNYLLLTLPNRQGDIIIRQGLNPFRQPTVRMENSDKYEQIEGSSTVSSAQPIEDSTSPSQEDLKKEIASLSRDQADKVISNFGDWLYQSDYGKDAVLTRGKIYDNLMLTGLLTSFWTLKTDNDSEILGRLVGIPQDFDLNDITDHAYVNGKEVSGQEFINYKNKFKVTLLGNDLSSNQAEDFQSTAAFRLYTRKDQKHVYLKSVTEEFDQLVNTSNIPDSEKNYARGMGYPYYFKNYVDQSKDSYQIVLATDGKVYYVKDYSFDSSKSIDKYVYEEAPEDMQEAYVDAISQYASNSDQTDESSDDDSLDYSKLEGTWKGKAQGGEEETVVYHEDKTVTLKQNGNKETNTFPETVKVSKNLYRFKDAHAGSKVIPTFGRGGIGFDVELGIRLNDDGSLTYIEWTGPYNSDFDPDTYKITELGTFTKEDD